MGFYCRNGSVGNNQMEAMGFISHHEIEGGLISNRMRSVVVSEFSMGDRFGPRCGVIATEDAEIGFYFLVHSFHFAVRLRVISGGEGKVVVEEFSEFVSKGGGELGSSVRDNFVKKSSGEKLCGRRGRQSPWR